MDRVAVVGLLALSACDADPHRASWSFRFVPDSLAARARVVDAEVRRGGCTSDDVVYRGAIGLGETTPRPPVLDPGNYGFAGSARDGACLWFAEGCEDRRLPIADGDTIVVELRALATEEPVCEVGACIGGVCAEPDAGIRDAGREDAGPLDAGPARFDAGPPVLLGPGRHDFTPPSGCTAIHVDLWGGGGGGGGDGTPDYAGIEGGFTQVETLVAGGGGGGASGDAASPGGGGGAATGGDLNLPGRPGEDGGGSISGAGGSAPGPGGAIGGAGVGGMTPGRAGASPGAGGGGAYGETTPAAGGGSGGYVAGTIVVTPGTPVSIIVGPGGPGGMGQQEGGHGGDGQAIIRCE